MKTRHTAVPIAIALAAGLTLSQQAFGSCGDPNCTDVSLTVCSADNTDCHDRYWIGYNCAPEVEYKITIHNGNDGKHTLGGGGAAEIDKKIQRWNWLKDAYVESINCCRTDGSACVLILDESNWR